MEGGKERLVCVEDKWGSLGRKCPGWIAGYCRGQNLRYIHPCRCSHPERPSNHAEYRLVPVDLKSAKGEEICSKFMSSAPFHNFCPRVVEIHAVKNEVLAKLHEKYRQYLRQKNHEEPTVRELYHGTNNRILQIVYQHGLQPPSDCKASEFCSMSGGKGLSTTLCNVTCKRCVERHHWDHCHMFGLGIYLAENAAKSHRYVSETIGNKHRMIVCSVLGRALEIKGHLTETHAMHDVPNMRYLDGRLEDMIEPLNELQDVTVEHYDLIFMKGLCHERKPGLSVFNSEYIAFHPHQCLLKYQITYEVDWI